MRTLSLLLTFVIFFTLIFMVFTNPKKDDYIVWVKEHALEKNSSLLEKDLTTNRIIQILNTSTTDTNYLIFTIYETKLDKSNFTTLGLCKKFFIYKK